MEPGVGGVSTKNPAPGEVKLSGYRLEPLPAGPAEGYLIVPAAVAAATVDLLQGSRGADGRHEGLAVWVGRREGDAQVVTAVSAPTADHQRRRVHAGATAMGAVLQHARARRLVFIAQVHSHPGADTTHSDADDQEVFMPGEGMFSVVVAHYGDGGFTQAGGVGLHQFQGGRWVWVTNPEAALLVVPTVLGSHP